jgi:hypothetical protein
VGKWIAVIAGDLAVLGLVLFLALGRDTQQNYLIELVVPADWQAGLVRIKSEAPLGEELQPGQTAIIDVPANGRIDVQPPLQESDANAVVARTADGRPIPRTINPKAEGLSPDALVMRPQGGSEGAWFFHIAPAGELFAGSYGEEAADEPPTD